MWVGNEHLNVPKAKQNLWVASLALKCRVKTFICLLADALVQNNVRSLAITLLFLIRAADMLSSVPKDMFKSDHVCDLDLTELLWKPLWGPFHWHWSNRNTWNCLGKPQQEPTFNQFPKTVVLHYRCGIHCRVVIHASVSSKSWFWSRNT